MEKKKILLIAIITGVFLAAVILFPLVLLSNSKATTTSRAVVPEIYNTPPASADVMGMVTSPPQQGDTSQNITINNYSPESNAVESAKNPDGSVTINVLPASPSQSATVIKTPTSVAPSQSTSVVEDTATLPNSQVKPSVKTPTVKTPTPAPSSTKLATPTPSAKTPTPKTQTRPAAKTAPKQQEKSEYWIQTGSFTVKANAEKAKMFLDGEGIPKVVVENSTVREQSVFRLRSGPHRNKDEAEFWLKLIKALDDFKESYVIEK